jgi:lysophospholipase L1-like esterase
MDPSQPEWLRSGLTTPGRPAGAGALRLRRPRAARRSRRGLLFGMGLAGATVAGGALLLPRVLADVAGLSDGLPFSWGNPAPPPAPGRTPLTAPLTYVAIGASDAVGMGTRDPAREGWVPLLAQQLPPGTRLVNLGIPGVALHDAVDQALPRAVAAQPGLITVWLVVNDVLAGVPLDRYRADLERLIGGLRSGTKAEIALGNLPDPPGDMGGVQIPAVVRRTIIGQWNDAIAATARAHDAVLVDLYRRWPVGEHPEFIGPDGLHPTAAGYRALAEVFVTTLREARLLA